MLAAGAIAVLYVLFAAASKPERGAGLSRFATGEMAALMVLEDAPPMPTRPLRDAAGNEATLAGVYDSEVIVMNLWATWCAPCVEELPTLAALQRRFSGRGVEVVTISVDSEGDRAKALRELARLSGGVLPFWIDVSRGVLFDVEAPGMPITIIYVRGEERARLAGGADWSSEEAAAMIEAALAGQ
jgi:thiol-disulfide isomerase/thioredoxin